MNWLGKLLLSVKQGPERINDYFRDAVKVYALSGEEASRVAALTAAKVAARQQRASMVAYLRGMALNSRKEPGAGVIRDRLGRLADDITTKDWRIADIRKAKLALGKLSPEYLTALNRFDAQVFERRWPELFADTPSRAIPLIFTVYAPSMEEARALTSHLQSLLDAEGANGFVSACIVVPELEARLGITQYPAYETKGRVIWQGSIPSRETVQEWLRELRS